jgi:hypothetical protein
MTLIGGSIDRPKLIDVLEVKPDTYKPGDTEELTDLLARTHPEREKRNTAYEDACNYEQQLAQTIAEVDTLKTQAVSEANSLLVSSADEIIACGAVCSARKLAALLRPVQDTVDIYQQAHDLLTFKRIPAARIQRLEAYLQFKRAEETEWSIAACLSQARTIEKLVNAGIFQNENRIALISEQTETLRQHASEASRQVRAAEDELRAERQRQTAAEQQRMATGAITRIEVASAVPVRGA